MTRIKLKTLNSVDKGHLGYTKQIFVVSTLLFTLISCGDDTPDVNQAPVFTSDTAFSTLDSLLDTGYQAAATDNEGDIIVYSITGGVDEVDFLIDVNTGKLSFVVEPDFKQPHDDNVDNIFEVQISATDDKDATSTLMLAITVSGSVIETYQLSMAMANMNLCGQIAQYNHYEAIVYADDGNIISRHVPNDEGQLEASFEQSHINLMIVRDTGTDTTDKKDLHVSVLTNYPVGDLGTLTIKSDDTEACVCQTATIYVLPGLLSSEKLNLPYSGFVGTTDYSQFNNTQLCELEDGLEALLVANNLDDDTGEISYRAIEDASQSLLDGSLPIDMALVGQVGRAITINSSDYGFRSITYVTDQTYNYVVTAKSSAASINVLDHDRVEQIEFHVTRQMDTLHYQTPVRFWGVHVPLTDDTTDIFYNKPVFEPELLSTLVENPSLTYNLDGENQRIITGFREFTRADNTVDEWHYLFPSQSDSGFTFALPADYLVGLAEGSQYQDLASYSDWQLAEIPVLNSLDELYQSDWLKVLLPTLTPVKIRPPTAYSYVGIEIYGE